MELIYTQLNLVIKIFFEISQVFSILSLLLTIIVCFEIRFVENSSFRIWPAIICHLINDYDPLLENSIYMKFKYFLFIGFKVKK